MSKCWYCNNELTSGDSPKHFGICNKCYDEMFKSGDTIIRSFTNKIADLEAKLAQKHKQLEKIKSDNHALISDNAYQEADIFELNSRIEQLQKQLAITEKALELAVDDKCFAENCIAESFIGKGAKVRVPRKEQYYLEKAKEMLEND